jgi:hypothetical protein
MNTDRLIQGIIQRMNINEYSLREQIVDIDDLLLTAWPNRNFVRFCQDEILIPYQYNLVEPTGADTGVKTVEFVLRSACSTLPIKNDVYFLSDNAAAPTAPTISKFIHVSTHRDFLCIEYAPASFIYTGTINVLILKILSKHKSKHTT